MDRPDGGNQFIVEIGQAVDLRAHVEVEKRINMIYVVVPNSAGVNVSKRGS
jgi:hypothetical protein